jgi:hypothetical protein
MSLNVVSCLLFVALSTLVELQVVSPECGSYMYLVAITLLYSDVYPQDSVPCIHPQGITELRIPFEFFCSICVISRGTELFLQTKSLQLILQATLHVVMLNKT